MDILCIPDGKAGPSEIEEKLSDSLGGSSMPCICSKMASMAILGPFKGISMPAYCLSYQRVPSEIQVGDLCPPDIFKGIQLGTFCPTYNL